MLNILLTRETRSLARFYRVELGYTLFGDYSVLREWGQAGRHGPKGGRRKLRVFTNLRDACVAAECWHRRAECAGLSQSDGMEDEGMTHLWVRAEQRPNEDRVGLTPEGAAALIAAGISVTVEESRVRACGSKVTARQAAPSPPENSWPDAPRDAIIFGLKELPEDGSPLPHRHIMFGHAYKGQPAGQVLLQRFGPGAARFTIWNIWSMTTGRRVAAFGYWAGYAGAAVTLKCWAAQRAAGSAGRWPPSAGKAGLLADLGAELATIPGPRPRALVIGALGRVGTGAADLCEAMGRCVTRWDMAETARGGPFPQVLAHEIFLNCILARPGCPVFVPASPRGWRQGLDG